jgi:hypothetical protein
MYKKDLLKEWSSGHLTSYRWYLDYLADNTLKSECGLRELFEDAHLDKPTSIDSSFKGGKKSQSAKKLRKTKDQFVRPLGDKRDEEDLKQEEHAPNPKYLQFRIVHQKRRLLNVDANPSLDLLQNPILDPIKL